MRTVDLKTRYGGRIKSPRLVVSNRECLVITRERRVNRKVGAIRSLRGVTRWNHDTMRRDLTMLLEFLIALTVTLPYLGTHRALW